MGLFGSTVCVTVPVLSEDVASASSGTDVPYDYIDNSDLVVSLDVIVGFSVQTTLFLTRASTLAGPLILAVEPLVGV